MICIQSEGGCRGGVFGEYEHVFVIEVGELDDEIAAVDTRIGAGSIIVSCVYNDLES